MRQHPRVFISYCQSSQGQWALDLASRLRSDGVDVIIDVWHLKPGHDLYAFMERAVTDKTVSNVLIICDKEYRNRSDRRIKGVGTEAQIISPALYGRVSQEKFIPILREYDRTRPCLPAYLANRLFLDFSTVSSFESYYSSLIDLIYGVDAPQPPLGLPRLRDNSSLALTNIDGGIRGLYFEDVSGVDASEILRRSRKMVADDPSPASYCLAGTMIAAAGLHRTAIEYLSHAVSGDETEPTAWFNLGQAYEITGQYDKASDALIRALKLRKGFVRLLREREPELPTQVREFLKDIEDRYSVLLGKRAERMKQAIEGLQSSQHQRADTLIKIDGLEIKKGSNLAQFIIRLSPDGVAMTFCYPEELREPEILLPFRIPKGVAFDKRKLSFLDHFGYKGFEFTQEATEEPRDIVFFSGVMMDKKLTPAYLLRWIIRSVLFQEAGEAFLEGRAYWEVAVDDETA